MTVIGTSANESEAPQPPKLADLHTHVIPGVDDGAPDLKSALDTLWGLRADGVVAVAATPHLSASDLRSARRARADLNWPQLAEAVQKNLPGLEVVRGYEIALDLPTLDLSDPELRLAGSRFALVEFYGFAIPHRSADVLGRIVDDGYVPILAHPERYWGYDQHLSVFREWRSAGALVQLNGGSLLGEYGVPIRVMARYLLRQGQVDLIASDNHARPSRNLSLRSVWDYLVENGLEEQARLLLDTNPRRILRDEWPLPVRPAVPRRRWWSRLVESLRGRS